MLKELVKGAASLTVDMAESLLHEVVEKVPGLDQVARKVGLRVETAETPVDQDAPVQAKAVSLAPSSQPAPIDASNDPPMPHNVPQAVAEAISHPEGDSKIKAKRGQKHGHH